MEQSASCSEDQLQQKNVPQMAAASSPGSTVQRTSWARCIWSLGSQLLVLVDRTTVSDEFETINSPKAHARRVVL